ncbi:MAG: lipoate--protein ligase family protein [Gemmatimonadales bacterium]
MANEWRLWVDRMPRPGWANMAIDQTLLERAAAGERWLRLYGWAPFCLSFGRHEPAAVRYDTERIAALGMDVVRRPTGGRAVWHGREVTYTVACPGGLGSLRESYVEIHGMIRDALRSLGVPAELAPPGAAVPVDSGACFACPAGGEIMAAGRKVVGSAQLRQGDALLQHGSILLDDDQAAVSAVTRGVAPGDRAAPLRSILGSTLDENDLIDAVTLTAARRWRGDWRSHDQPHDVVLASERHAPRFRSAEWTWGAGS